VAVRSLLLSTMVGAEGPVGSCAASAISDVGSTNDVHTPKVVLLGPRRAGKSSLCKVVYESYLPNDTLFLTPTMRIQKINTHTFQRLQLWDVPGSSLMSFSGGALAAGPAPGLADLDIPWADVCAVIFVIDAQDDYFDAVTKLNQVVVTVFSCNKAIQFHVFINKVDGLSEDYKYDTQRDIEQRVMEGLIDSSHELQDNGEPVDLDRQVNIKFYLTSIFDSSVFVAFSRIQQQLLQGLNEPNPASPSVRMVSLTEALETACNLLCSTCQFEKAYLFDIPSRTFVACDTSPFDLSLFDVMYQYIRFLRQFTELYQTESDVQTADAPAHARTWSTSVVQFTSDTTVAFWQLDRYVFAHNRSVTWAFWLSYRATYRRATRAFSYVAPTHPRITTWASSGAPLPSSPPCRRYHVPSTAAAGRTSDTMSADVAAPVDAGSDRFVARPVRYCEICSFPYEYCEYGSSLSRCKANLEAKDPDLFRQLYSDEALEDKLKSLTTEQAESLERESAKKERKAAAKAEKERAQLAASKIVLSRVARTKRKVITCIHGLHQFSPPMPALKVIAKGYVALLTPA